ncbi:hypothetical protein NQ314_004624 [Rhamnusium bicolor]|uniref:Uncharacterized protein n=1 Tax=Rhamnusium bicolor TaxID=1586634 RepID=A0AAV8ZM77_9CUCU|nr:hypothetical protein NQ314_004624 [Rhamnusium bicolor]
MYKEKKRRRGNKPEERFFCNKYWRCYFCFRNRNRSVYSEVLDKLKKEFYERWEKISVSSSQGLDEFIHIKTLGTGSFGRVVLAKHKEHDADNFYAIKVIEKTLIMKLKQVEHTMFFNDLYTFRMHRFTEVLSKFYGAQVILALEFLHHCDILYRDLKPENILIDQKGYIKIADLGFCKVDRKGRTWTLCGTPDYIAPEIILSKGYGKAVDWWSFGVLLFEMNAGFPPFSSSDPMRIYEKIIVARYKMPRIFSTDLQDIIKNLLQTDLSRRFGNLRNGIQDLKNHKWFKDTDWLAVYNRQVEPPFKPTIKSTSDTTNFDPFESTQFKISEHDLYKEEFLNF